jgi:hypothetical protein
VERQHMMRRAFGAKEQLAAKFIDGLQAPLIVVELRLRAQVDGFRPT